MNIEKHLGNLKLLEEDKTAFICSRKIPAGVVLKSYDWAIAMRNAGKCVISGFHSPRDLQNPKCTMRNVKCLLTPPLAPPRVNICVS